MKRFCLRCGRLLNDGEKCICQNNIKKQYEYHSNDFYQTKGWRNLSRYVRIRDFNLDRLQLYFCKYKPVNNIEQQLYDFLIVEGEPRKMDGKLLVHHIKEIEEAWNERLDANNCITLNFHVHEFVHHLYLHNKTETQQLLHKAVNADLP